MIHHRRHSLITKRGKKKNQKKRKKLRKQELFGAKRRNLFPPFGKNPTQLVVSLILLVHPFSTLMNLRKSKTDHYLPLLRDSTLLCHGVKEASVCTIASMIRGGDTRKRILNVMPGYTGIRFQLHSSWHEHVSRYTISLIYRKVT